VEVEAGAGLEILSRRYVRKHLLSKHQELLVTLHVGAEFQPSPR
jgi:hypothetical protein